MKEKEKQEEKQKKKSKSKKSIRQLFYTQMFYSRTDVILANSTVQ